MVEEYRGRVVELRGDEALVVFGSPRSAIRAAVALQQRFVEETIADPSLPLTVGIGLDAGEAVPVEGGYRGGALNVAGRLSRSRAAGEVLASREIVHLARRIDGVRFTERGQAELKGIDQPVHVVAVRSEHRDAAEAMAPFVRSTAPAPALKRWKVVAAPSRSPCRRIDRRPLIARRSGGSSEIAPNSIGILDPESGEAHFDNGARGPPGFRRRVGGSRMGDQPRCRDRHADRPERAGVRGLHPGRREPDGDRRGERRRVGRRERRAVRLADQPRHDIEVVKTIEVGNGPAGIAVGEGGVWVTNRFDGTLSRIDPDAAGREDHLGRGGPRGVAVGFGSVWVALAGSSMVVRIDPQTNSVVQPIGVGNAPGSLAVSADALGRAQPRRHRLGDRP